MPLDNIQRVARGHRAFREYAHVEPCVARLGDPAREHPLPVLAGELATWHPWLADLHGRPAGPEHVAHADVRFEGPRDGEDLGEGGGFELAPERPLPVRVMVERIDADRLVRSAVVCPV